MLRYLVIIFAACAAAPEMEQDPVAGASQDGIASKSPLGTNLTGIKDWSAEWTFVDAFKASRSWISGSATAWDDGRALAVDENGWVRSLLTGQIARTFV